METMFNKDDLERYIDRYGLLGTLEHIVTICYEKAEHIEHSWQDRPTAKTWKDDAKVIAALVVGKLNN